MMVCKTSRSDISLVVRTISLLLLLFVAPQLITAQSLDRIERERALSMLNVIKGDLKSNYYDPTFRGMDVETRFKTAEERVKAATTLGQAFGIIAQVLLDLNDSHTVFIPPSRPETIIYGWQMQMIGDKCYVVAVKPGSDAAAQGLKEGDLVISYMGFKPTRKEFWKMRYYFTFISPRPALRAVVQSPGGQPRELEMKARIKPGAVVVNATTNLGLNELIRQSEDNYLARRHRYYDKPEVLIWKMPAFDLEDSDVDKLVDKAKSGQGLVIDMRGNGGGAETTLQRLIGSFIDKDYKVGDVTERKKSKPLMAKTRGTSGYKGKLVLLIDSESGSSAEIFARVMQMEKRAVVIGDVSSGKVMRSRFNQHDLGTSTMVLWGASITDADLIMADGKSLENVGVTPDELVLPSAEDMAAKRDVVMVRALELVGVKMTPEQAGKLFPIIWEK
jgi:C-terminal processing protease CtpA/Prc